MIKNKPTMDTNRNMAVVQGIFDAFNKGDLPTILSSFSEDADFREPGPEKVMPWVKPRKGREEIAAYLGEVMQYLQFQPLEIRKIFAQDNHVIVIGYACIKVLKNGQHAEAEFVMTFELKNGEVVHYRNYYDTYKFVAAIRGE